MEEGGGNFLIPGHLITLFEESTLYEIALSIFAGLVICAIAGFVIRRAPGLVLPAGSGEDGQEAYIVSAVLGLLALLMGFTFSLALDRYEDRRELVLQEANALGTAYLRAQLLPEPARSDISAILSDYTDNRIDLAGQRKENFAELLATNDALLVDLWARTVAAVENAGATPITSQFVASINEVIDLDASRKNARAAKVPSAVYAVLFIYFMVAAAILGYVLTGFWSRLAAVFLFVLFTLSLLLIIDIDRPLVGELREDQLPMEQLRDFIAGAPPDRFATTRAGQ